MTGLAWGVWGGLVLAGAVVVALPDAGDPLVRFSRTHGPSPVDAVGIALILAGWSVLLGGVWRRRGRLPRTRAWRVPTVASLAAGAGLTAWSVLGDHGAWWVVGAVLLAAPQVAAGVAVTRRR